MTTRVDALDAATGKVLASLAALRELGLIEIQNSRYQPTRVEGKRDLDSAPVLQSLRALAQP